MDLLFAYLPIAGLVLISFVILLITDRVSRWGAIRSSVFRLFHRNNAAQPARTKRWFSVQRVVLYSIVLFLISYVWTYQRIQDVIATQLAVHNITGIQVRSLIIPYSAFFQSEYIANTGFSKSRKRTRIDVAIRGHVWSSLTAEIDEQGAAQINRIAGKRFVFAYLSDVKVLRPAIERHMKELIRNKQIDKFKIETFDNRGPYILVALNIKNREKDVNAIASSLAHGLHLNLTKTNQLKVNQVVMKIVDPEPYITNNTIKVIGRGTAGIY